MTTEQLLIKNNLNFQVAKQPAGAIINGKFTTSPKQYATYRTDVNEVLGIVGKRYNIIDNKVAFDFIDSIIDTGDIEWTNAFSKDNGAIVMLQAKLPDHLILENNDKIEKYLTFINSHNGSYSCRVMISPVRMVCQNQLTMFSKMKNGITIRHTNSYKDKLSQAQQILGLGNTLYNTVENELNSLLEIPLPDSIDNMLDNLYFDVEELNAVKSGKHREEVISTRKLNTINSVKSWYINGVGQQNLKDNAFKYINAISGFYTHETNADYHDLILGQNTTYLNKAYSQLV